ncbi:MAG: histidine triad nucleotide-binding protein [Chloroflexi bacterium]|nr:histidine triad nucleotide-binding protein [Chloroflexota bacterium]|tara:strand:- start:493 stop:837 length:345 start_codon:yes stop_codon:yes gene_type:complete
MKTDCIFCKIKKGEIKSEILYSNQYCFVIKDISPRAQVHLLVIPNKHIEELVNMDKGDQVIIGEMFASAQRLATDTGISDSGYRLIINQGEHSGQMVDHLHLHVIGGEQLGGMV